MFKRLFLLLTALVLMAGCAAAEDDVARGVENLVGGVIACETAKAGASGVQAWIDGALAQNAGRGAEWFVFALSQRGAYDFSRYLTALDEYESSAAMLTPVTRQKLALARLAAGGEAADCTDTVGQQGVMSWIYGLHLIANGCPCSVPAADALTALLDLQLADGGWAVSGEVADPDVTAMALQALAPHRADARVAAAIDRALALLSARQLPEGGYASYGVINPESPAQVLTALAALGIDGLADPRFIKEGTLLDAIAAFRLEDGSFSHTLGGVSNQNATVQVLYGLTAWQRLKSGQPPLYQLDRRTPEAPGSYKPVAAACVAGAAALACIALLMMKKRSGKNFIAVAVIAAALVAFVYATDFQTADSYYTAPAAQGEPIGTATLSIDCSAVAGRADYLPADGVMLPPTEFPIYEGDTAFTLLTRAARAHGLHMEHSAGYVSGLGYLYEFAHGDLSGWIYFVNGESASVGADQHRLQDGDRIDWRYTLEMGADLR
ncbi:MAG: DUF4430 domain-containing protein [Clostridia bacterium]|nr:DUF4430 domain-containing protein [Clostridia bacterium]